MKMAHLKQFWHESVPNLDMITDYQCKEENDYV